MAAAPRVGPTVRCSTTSTFSGKDPPRINAANSLGLIDAELPGDLPCSPPGCRPHRPPTDPPGGGDDRGVQHDRHPAARLPGCGARGIAGEVLPPLGPVRGEVHRDEPSPSLLGIRSGRRAANKITGHRRRAKTQELPGLIGDQQAPGRALSAVEVPMTGWKANCAVRPMVSAASRGSCTPGSSTMIRRSPDRASVGSETPSASTRFATPPRPDQWTPRPRPRSRCHGSPARSGCRPEGPAPGGPGWTTRTPAPPRSRPVRRPPARGARGAPPVGVSSVCGTGWTQAWQLRGREGNSDLDRHQQSASGGTHVQRTSCARAAAIAGDAKRGDSIRWIGRRSGPRKARGRPRRSRSSTVRSRRHPPEAANRGRERHRDDQQQGHQRRRPPGTTAHWPGAPRGPDSLRGRGDRRGHLPGIGVTRPVGGPAMTGLCAVNQGSGGGSPRRGRRGRCWPPQPQRRGKGEQRHCDCSSTSDPPHPSRVCEPRTWAKRHRPTPARMILLRIS